MLIPVKLLLWIFRAILSSITFPEWSGQPTRTKLYWSSLTAHKPKAGSSPPTYQTVLQGLSIPKLIKPGLPANRAGMAATLWDGNGLTRAKTFCGYAKKAAGGISH